LYDDLPEKYIREKIIKNIIKATDRKPTKDTNILNFFVFLFPILNTALAEYNPASVPPKETTKRKTTLIPDRIGPPTTRGASIVNSAVSAAIL
jgi:hypothetical protein